MKHKGNKRLSMLLTLAVLMQLISPCLSAKADTVGFVFGDVNADGKVTLKDASVIQLYAADLAVLSSREIYLGDIDGDGDAQLKDAYMVQQYVVSFHKKAEKNVNGYAIGDILPSDFAFDNETVPDTDDGPTDTEEILDTEPDRFSDTDPVTDSEEVTDTELWTDSEVTTDEEDSDEVISVDLISEEEIADQLNGSFERGDTHAENWENIAGNPNAKIASGSGVNGSKAIMISNKTEYTDFTLNRMYGLDPKSDYKLTAKIKCDNVATSKKTLNGAWIMGLRTYPMMAGLPDISVRNKEKYKNDFLVEDVEAALIRYLRRVKPEVVMTHDVNGEYGHWQHCIVAEAIQLAVVDAATPACDPASAEQYGVWQVKKLYLHLSETNPIFISATVPLEAFGGRSAWEVAQEAYQCHQSQRLWYHLCNNENENSLEKFGLVFSTVGSDTGVNDMFENIAPETLTDFVPTPAPTDTPTPLSAVTATPSPTAEPTAVPTDTPTPAPTAVPTDTPTAVPTEAPTEAPTAAPTEEPEQLLPRAVTANFRLILAGLAAILVILIGGLAAVLIVRKKVEK